VKDGEAAVEGDFALPGVAGVGARIRLDFLDPGGAATGKLLPTGQAREMLGGVPASLVDATNPMVFVCAHDLGLKGTESPEAIDADAALGARLEALRVEAAERMGIPGSTAVPKIALVAPPGPFTTLDGARHDASEADLLGRVISMSACHRAFALTSAMCLAVAARVPGTVVHEYVGGATGDVRLAHPSGVLPVAAAVSVKDGALYAEQVTVYRSARRLMEGFVRVP
jgi:2-methylaconitate cis-trans-isomerase PrpF